MYESTLIWEQNTQINQIRVEVSVLTGYGNGLLFEFELEASVLKSYLSEYIFRFRYVNYRVQINISAIQSKYLLLRIVSLMLVNM